MANLHNLFIEFDKELNITASKKDSLMKSRDNIRKKIKSHFEDKHPKYKPTFYIQGSYKLGTLIRTKDDTCDLDDGVYFKENPDDVTGTTLQKWVKEALDGITGASPIHKKKCIRAHYANNYDIDIPVFVFDEDTESHPNLAVKDSDFQEDDPKEFVDKFKKVKTEQMVRMVKYLKAWCDYKRQDMPSGLSMTVLTMKHYLSNDKDDVVLKTLLIEIERALKINFSCRMLTTPKDDLFQNYSDAKKQNTLANLSSFIEDAKKAIDEKNKKKASEFWKKHLGDRFPIGEDENEEHVDSNSLKNTIGTSSPYFVE